MGCALVGVRAGLARDGVRVGLGLGLGLRVRVRVRVRCRVRVLSADRHAACNRQLTSLVDCGCGVVVESTCQGWG